MSDDVVLSTDGLLSKWGFEDGDTLSELACDWRYDEGLDVDYKDLLVELVRRFVLPILDQQVEVYTLTTSHNPIRARRVDGVEGDEHGENEGITLTPETVTIPMAQVRAVAEELARTKTTAPAP